MNLPASYLASFSAPLGSALAAPRRIGKAASCGNFGGTFGDFEPCWDGLSRPSPESGVCQNETRAYAPLWIGSVLRPAFAAQVLGQVIIEREIASSYLAARSYRNGVSRIPAALLLDVSV